jgi:hypothetical protein
MTIKQLQEIIIKNFTNKAGVIDISGLTFHTDVNMSNVVVNGNFYQNNLRVFEHLEQSDLGVNGNLEQRRQKVNGNLDQRGQKVGGNFQHTNPKQPTTANFLRNEFLKIMTDGLSIKDLEEIIKNNFTSPDTGTIHLEGLRFDADINLTDLHIDGDLILDNIYVGFDLHKHNQEIVGDIYDES